MERGGYVVHCLCVLYASLFIKNFLEINVWILIALKPSSGADREAILMFGAHFFKKHLAIGLRHYFLGRHPVLCRGVTLISIQFLRKNQLKI